MVPSCTVSDTNEFEKYCDLEISGSGITRASDLF